MLRSIVAAGCVIAALGGADAVAGDRRGYDDTTVCLTVNGDRAAAVCRRSSTWGADDTCVCPGSSTPVKASWCAGDERPPVENRALKRARKEAARDGSLVGDSFEGRPMCVRPPRPR